MKKLLFALAMLVALDVRAAGTFVAVSVETGSTFAASLASGTTWTASASTAARTVNYIAYGNGVFCAVGQGGTTHSESSLDNGVTWTDNGSMVGMGAYAIAYGAGVFVIGGSAAQVYTSPDCVTWTSHSYAFSTTILAIVWDPINALFIAGGATWDTATSPDGITWTTHSAPLYVYTNYAASCAGTTMTGTTGSGAGMNKSTTGLAWTHFSNTGNDYHVGIACSDALHFVIISSSSTAYANAVYTTDGGTTWNNATGWGSFYASSIAWNGSEYVATAPSTTAFAHSANGAAWTVESTGFVSLAAPALAASVGGAAPAKPACMLGGGFLC